jgi:hypothetical protein
MAFFLTKDGTGAEDGRDGGGGLCLPLDEIRKAHEMLEGMRSRPRGKVALTVSA